MPINKRAINDFLRQQKAIDHSIQRLLSRAGRLRKSSSPKLAGKVAEQLLEINSAIATAKAHGEYLRSHFENNPEVSSTMSKALKARMDKLTVQSERLKNVSLRVLSMVKPGTGLDATAALLRSAPKAPKHDPKIGALVKNTLDRMQAAAVEKQQPLTRKERSDIIRQTRGNLSAKDVVKFSLMFRAEVKNRQLETLQSISVPKEAPPQVEAAEPTLSAFEQKVQEFAKLSNFDDVREAIFDHAKTPKERFDMIVAVREEIQGNKLTGDMPEVPKDDPTQANR